MAIADCRLPIGDFVLIRDFVDPSFACFSKPIHEITRSDTKGRELLHVHQ